MMSRARRYLLVAAVAALAAALSIPIPGVDQPTGQVTLLDVSASHGPDPHFLIERARLRGGKGPLVIFGRSASILHSTAANWPAEIPATAPDFASESNFVGGCRAVTAIPGIAGSTVELMSDGAFEAAEFEAGKAILKAAGLSLIVMPPLSEPSEGVFLEVPFVAEAAGNKARVLVDVVSTARSPRRVDLTAVAEGGVTWSGEVLAGGRTRLGGDVPVGPATTSVRVSLRQSGGVDLLGGAHRVDIPVERVGRRLVATLGEVPLDVLQFAHGFDRKRCASWHELAESALQADVLVVADMPLEPHDAADLESLTKSITERGVGLVVIGGPRAYREGGYASSPLGRLLPVDCGLAAKDIRVALDRSGSMDREGRWRQAVDAVEALARATSDSSTLWIVPFSQEPGTPIPAAPAPALEFLSRGLESLLRLTPSGGTKILPAVAAAARPPVKAGAMALLAIVSDFDDQGLDADLGALKEGLRARRFEVLALVLDPSPDALARAGRVASKVVPVRTLDARVLIENLEASGYHISEVVTQTPAGAVGPTFSAKHRVSLAKDSRADLITADGAPILASVERGRGRVLALAAPSPNAELSAELALRAARPVSSVHARGSLDRGRLTVKMSTGAPSMRAPVSVRDSVDQHVTFMRETGPGAFESTDRPSVAGRSYWLVDALGNRTPFTLAPSPPAEWRAPRRDWPSPPAEPPRGGGSRWIWGAVALLASLLAIRSRP